MPLATTQFAPIAAATAATVTTAAATICTAAADRSDPDRHMRGVHS